MTEPTLETPHDEAEELLPWYVTAASTRRIASASRSN